MLNSSLESQPDFIYNETGKITGYKTKVGADTVFPFKKESRFYLNGAYNFTENDNGIVLGNNSARGYNSGKYVIATVGFDTTDFSSLSFSISGNTGQSSNKQLDVYVCDELDGSTIKTYTTKTNYYPSPYTKTHTLDISELTGFKFFKFYKISDGWEPSVNAGIVLKH